MFYRAVLECVRGGRAESDAIQAVRMIVFDRDEDVKAWSVYDIVEVDIVEWSVGRASSFLAKMLNSRCGPTSWLLDLPFGIDISPKIKRVDSLIQKVIEFRLNGDDERALRDQKKREEEAREAVKPMAMDLAAKINEKAAELMVDPQVLYGEVWQFLN